MLEYKSRERVRRVKREQNQGEKMLSIIKAEGWRLKIKEEKGNLNLFEEKESKNTKEELIYQVVYLNCTSS